LGVRREKGAGKKIERVGPLRRARGRNRKGGRGVKNIAIIHSLR